MKIMDGVYYRAAGCIEYLPEEGGVDGWRVGGVAGGTALPDGQQVALPDGRQGGCRMGN